MPKKKTPPPAPARPAFPIWKLLALVVALPLVGFAAWRGGVMVYGEFQVWRSGRLAAEAADFLLRGDPAAARLSAEASLRNNPRNIDALRLLAGFQLEAGEDAAALETFQTLSAAGGLSEPDARAYARLAGRAGKWDVADGLVAALRAGPPTVETPFLEADLALLRKDTARAEARLREALQIEPGSRARARLVDFFLEHRLDRQTAPEVRELLLQDNRLDTETGLRLLGAALDKTLAPPQETPRWIAELRAHPLADPGTLLVADRAEVRFDPSAKTRVAQTLFARSQPLPFEQRQAAFFWLRETGQPALAAQLLALNEAVREPALFEAWLETLADSGRADEAFQALGTPANPLDARRNALQRGRAARLLGRNDEADAAYAQAFELAAPSPDQTLELAEFLARARETAFFEDALARLLADPRQAPAALEKLLPVVRGWRDTAGLRAFCEAMEISPGLSPEDRLRLRNEIAYCDLVLAKKTNPAAIAEMSSQNPGDLLFQTTQALAHLRAGKSESAVEALVITQAPPDDPYLLARHKAVQAMALAAYGDSAQATLHYRGLAKEFLSNQESALVEQFLKKPGRRPR
jgi:tetratricopeptide (TPR) repeat protein